MPVRTRRGHTGRYRQDQAFGRPFKLNKNSPQARGLAAWWPMLHSGDTVRDLAGGFDMAKVNGPALVTVPEFGQAMNFIVGSSQYLTRFAALSTIPFSVTAWARITADTVLNRVIYSERTDHRNQLVVRAAETVRYIFTGTEGTDNITSAGSISIGVWYHFVMLARSVSDRELYLDAVSLGTNSTTITPVGINETHIGQDGLDDLYFDGDIADVRFYNYALSPSEIHQQTAPQTMWDLYAPIPRVFPVTLPAPPVGTRLVSPAVQLLRRVLTPRSRL